jgi:predicted Zn-dependent peptidase
MSDYFVDQLPNGVRLVTVPMPHLHSVELVCYLSVGGRCEKPSQSGVSHFLEHMLFRGTAEYANSTDLERAFEAIGGSVNASTDAETTCFHSRIHPDFLSEGVAIFASMLRRPKFSDVETERRIILEEAREDFNEHGQQINPDNLMVRMLWPNHPLGESLIGSLENLHRISVDDLKQYYQSWYQPEHLVVCACGAVDRAEMIQAVTDQFGDWESGDKQTIEAAPQIIPSGSESQWVQDSDSQISLQVAFPLPGRSDHQTLAVRLMRRVLSWGGGARLTLRLREELGLTYAVEANCSMMSDAGYLAIDLSVAPDNMVQAVSELLNVLAEIRENPLSEEELAAIIKSYIFDLDFSRDQTDSLAVRYGWGTQAEYLRTLDQDVSELKEVTPVDLQNAARDFFCSEAMKLVVVGPWSETDRHAVEELIETKRLG